MSSAVIAQKQREDEEMRTSYLMEEVLAVMTAMGVVVTAQDPNLENQMLAWCLAGSVGAALASIALWLPDTLRGRICMFIANCLIGLIFGPFAASLLHDRWGWVINMPNCLAVSAVLSMSAFAVIKPLGPLVSNMLVGRLAAYSEKRLDETFGKGDK